MFLSKKRRPDIGSAARSVCHRRGDTEWLFVKNVSEGPSQRFSETQEMDQVPEPSSGRTERAIILTVT